MNLTYHVNLGANTFALLMDAWNKVYPKSINYSKLEDFISELTQHQDYMHILAHQEDELVGWYFDFIREEERWFGIIVFPGQHKQGIGKMLMHEAMNKRAELNGWVIPNDQFLKSDGNPYPSPLKFYKKLGFKAHPEIGFTSPKITTIKISWKKF